MAHNKLYRNFIILQGDEKKISDDKACSGYAKVEAKGDRCKISFYAQNLSQEEKYSIVLICYKKDFKQIVDLGSLKIREGGKGEVTKEYYVNDIAGLGIDYGKISGAAVMLDREEGSKYILYGFMSGEHIKDDWKKCKKVKHKDNDDNWKDDIVIEEKKQKEKSNLDDNKQKKDKGIPKDTDKKYEKKSEHKEKISENKLEVSKENKNDKEKCYKDEKIKEDKINKEECNKAEQLEVDNCCENKEQCKCKHKYLNDDHDDKDKCNRDIGVNIDFAGYENDIEDNKEVDCFDFDLRGEIGEYFSEVAKGFEEIKHKFKDIKYCKWYKVNVNNIEDMCNVEDYSKYTVVYYPMLNYFPYIKKYGYFLLGYKCDKRGNAKYVVYGIPGRKDIEEQPYMGKTGFVTWMPERNSNRGYWLMFYDYKKSIVVVPMKQ